MKDVNALLSTCQLEPVWFVRAELADRDDARVREAVTGAVGLVYGSYDSVAFESARGMQYCRPIEGSHEGSPVGMVEIPVRELRFSLTRDPGTLARALEAIRAVHSYEEPVISVTEGWATRADYSKGKDNPNRWWNREGER